ncbi:MAG: hypothetical protein GY714_02935 [Desulfobacterales bacterium]|nr:hypothetical protein [Desulfobacterales bacterium]MCP4163489.1 hypothetical protein [Deltaproteobacteria bacterium]
MKPWCGFVKVDFSKGSWANPEKGTKIKSRESPIIGVPNKKSKGNTDKFSLLSDFKEGKFTLQQYI